MGKFYAPAKGIDLIEIKKETPIRLNYYLCKIMYNLFIMKKSIDPSLFESFIGAALKEDIGSGDITTNAIVSEKKVATGRILAKEDFIACGLEIFKYVFLTLDNNIEINIKYLDGEKVRKGDTLATLSGSARALLSGERVALNILQRLSGIATLTSKFVEKVPASIKILDTRKTFPGLRTLEKYAVQCGGGANHRFGLYDAILIKDNHIKAVGSITKAVEMVRVKFPNIQKIEVEVKNIAEVKEALLTPCNILLLDNMSPDDIKKAVDINNNRAKIEVSGNVTLHNIHEITGTRIDFISVGALTHSAQAVDISMIIN